MESITGRSPRRSSPRKLLVAGGAVALLALAGTVMASGLSVRTVDERTHGHSYPLEKPMPGPYDLSDVPEATAPGQVGLSPFRRVEPKPARLAAPARMAAPKLSGPYDLSDVPEATAPGQVGLSPFRRVEVVPRSHERATRW
jgi:hypothetical protein